MKVVKLLELTLVDRKTRKEEGLGLYYSTKDTAEGPLERAKRAYAHKEVMLKEKHFVVDFEHPTL